MGSQWRSEAETRVLVRRAAGFSRGHWGLIWPCLCLDNRTEQAQECPRVGSNFRYQKKSPRSANSRPLGRVVVVRNPRANPHEHSAPFGQDPRSGASWHLSSCHSTRISGPLIPSLRSFPHALAASSPGCSSSAELGDDLADGSSCRARTALRYGA